MSKPLIETTAEKVALHDNAAHSLAHRRELARRHSGGFEVTLYWSPDDNITSVEISQPATEEPLLFNVPRARALDAFYHPFSHLTAGGFVFADAGASAEEERWNATLWAAPDCRRRSGTTCRVAKNRCREFPPVAERSAW